MPEGTRVPDEKLMSAYRNTLYRVDAPGREIVLRVDQHDDQLAKLLREAGVQRAALLTAYNPGSRPRAAQQNEAEQRALEAGLRDAGHPCLPARNEPRAAADRPHWTERSVLVLDIGLEAAQAIAARLGQVAFLWIGADATPRLIATARAS